MADLNSNTEPALTVPKKLKPFWVKIGIFVFCAALASVAIFYINKDAPESYMTFSPKPSDESTLIWYDSYNPDNFKRYTTALDEFLRPYKNPSIDHKDNLAPSDVCVYGINSSYKKVNKVCPVEVEWKFRRCSSSEQYGYSNLTPCVFIKFNKILNWTPEFYKDSSQIPTEMPENMKDNVINYINRRSDVQETIWISCEGEDPADKENIRPIQYFPQRGFPGYYFPYVNQKGYLEPFMAVYFERPKTGVLINVICKVWARNIDPNDPKASLRFQLMID